MDLGELLGDSTGRGLDTEQSEGSERGELGISGGMVGRTGGGGVGEVMLEVAGEEGFMVTGVREGGDGWADSDVTLGERG